MNSDCIKIIDSHVHFWNPSDIKYPWISEIPLINLPQLPAEFEKEINQATSSDFFTGGVFIQSGTLPEDFMQEVIWVLNLQKNFPKIKGIVAGAPLEGGEQSKVYLEKIASIPQIKGVRRILQGERPDFCLTNDFIIGVKMLTKLNLSFDICIKGLDQMSSAIALASKLENQLFVLDHCGKPFIDKLEIKQWRKKIEEISKLDNVYCKVSGLLTEMSEEQNDDVTTPYLDAIFQNFEINKIMYGGDWPVCKLGGGYNKWFEIIKTYCSNFSKFDKNSFYYENAKKFYNLEI